jgi:spore coat polysaccharide biosynthesis predicted glycosyltransferase SpsG
VAVVMPRRADWAFRVSSRPEVGAGHMMRCLALAEQMRGSVSFFIDSEESWRDRLERAGFLWRLEDAPGRVDRVGAALSRGEVGGVVLDGYEFEPASVRMLSRAGFTVQIVDDEEVSEAALAVRPGLDATTPERALSGPAYALLGRAYEHAHARALARSAAEDVERLLVCFGAHDSGDATGKTLTALAALPDRPEVVVVLGGRAPHLQAIRAQARRFGRVTVMADVDDTSALSESCDLAIGGGGQALLERMCCGLPSIVMTQAANQEPNARAAAAAGAAAWARSLDGPEGLSATTMRLLSDGAARRRIRDAGLALVDGRGAKRCARAIERCAEACPRALPAE